MRVALSTLLVFLGITGSGAVAGQIEMEMPADLAERNLEGSSGYVGPSTQSTADLIAAPYRSDLTQSSEVLQMFSEILAAGDFGHHEHERAAFIIRRDDGSLACELWPATRAFKRETYYGSLPRGTVAIAHTHPVQHIRPSPEDRKEARRVGIPIYVLTLTNIQRADPDSSEVVSLRNRRWYQPGGKTSLCNEGEKVAARIHWARRSDATSRSLLARRAPPRDPRPQPMTP